MDKAAVFIDGGYTAQVLKQHGSPRIDFLLLSDKLCSKIGAERFRTYYYDCMPYKGDPPSEEESIRFRAKSTFITALKRNPRFEVRLGRLARYARGGIVEFQQKGVDNQLSVDLALLSGRRDIQKAILITADSDFVPAICAAKEAAVLCGLCFSRSFGRPHDQLYDLCDERFDLDELINELKPTAAHKV